MVQSTTGSVHALSSTSRDRHPWRSDTCGAKSRPLHCQFCGRLVFGSRYFLLPPSGVSSVVHHPLGAGRTRSGNQPDRLLPNHIWNRPGTSPLPLPLSPQTQSHPEAPPSPNAPLSSVLILVSLLLYRSPSSSSCTAPSVTPSGL